MSAPRPHEPWDEEQIDRVLREALDVAPSPDFRARVAARVALEPVPHRRTPWVWWSGAAAALAAGMAWAVMNGVFVPGQPLRLDTPAAVVAEHAPVEPASSELATVASADRVVTADTHDRAASGEASPPAGVRGAVPSGNFSANTSVRAALPSTDEGEAHRRSTTARVVDGGEVEAGLNVRTAAVFDPHEREAFQWFLSLNRAGSIPLPSSLSPVVLEPDAVAALADTIEPIEIEAIEIPSLDVPAVEIDEGDFQP